MTQKETAGTAGTTCIVNQVVKHLVGPGWDKMGQKKWFFWQFAVSGKFVLGTR